MKGGERRRQHPLRSHPSPMVGPSCTAPLGYFTAISLTDAFPLPTSVYQPLSPERIHDLLPQLTSSPPLPTSTLSPPPSPSQAHLNPVAREFVPGQTWNKVQDESSMAPSFAEALRGNPPPIWPIKTSPRQHTASAEGKLYEIL